MVMAKPSYEECRLRRVEENKKRMEALNLPLLAQSLCKKPSIKPSRNKQAKPTTSKKQEVVLRRSSRVANKSTPDYNESDLSNRVYASDEAREHAVEKAEKLESSLGPEYPTFVKPMLESHCTGGFWLGLPGYFCRRNLPKRDEAITLLDEDGGEYPTKYLPRRTGLSGGWEAFAVAHGLVDGDALVFQLIRNTAFKVYIIRVLGSDQRNYLSSSESHISVPVQSI